MAIATMIAAAAIDLVALDSLLEERHVRRAALRIGLSQPAMSNALARLRATFADPLLVQTSAGMEPTARGTDLATQVRQILRQMERVFTSEAGFDPAACERRFIIRMSDLLGGLFLPAIAARLMREAPRASLEIVHLPPAQTVAAIESDTCDLAISMSLVHAGSIRAEPLVSDRMICVMREGHPAAKVPLDIEGVLRLEQLRVSISPVDGRFVDDVLARLGRQRRVAVNVPHWLVASEVLRATDLATVTSARLADVLAPPEDGFVHHELPFGPSEFDWGLYWHQRHERCRIARPAVRRPHGERTA
jgi:DNA-binding transcriptional LysR family regulator